MPTIFIVGACTYVQMPPKAWFITVVVSVLLFAAAVVATLVCAFIFPEYCVDEVRLAVGFSVAVAAQGRWRAPCRKSHHSAPRHGGRILLGVACAGCVSPIREACWAASCTC